MSTASLDPPRSTSRASSARCWWAGARSCSASSRSGSRCRRCWCARRCRRSCSALAAIGLGVVGDPRGAAPARLGSGRLRASSCAIGAIAATQSGETNLERVDRLVRARRRHAALRHAADLRGPRRRHLRALRRRQHRARGDDARRRLLRHLRRRPHQRLDRRPPHRDDRRRPARARARDLRRSHSAPTRSSPASRSTSSRSAHRLHLPPPLRRRGHPGRPPPGPRRHPPDRLDPVLRPSPREPQPARLGRPHPRLRGLALRLPHARRPAAAVGGREPARGGHRRDLGLQDALPRGHRLGRAGGDGRSLPLDRLRPLVQPEHDRGPRVHRARGRDRGQVAPGGGAGGGADVRLLPGAGAAARRCSRRARRRCCRRCRTW